MNGILGPTAEDDTAEDNTAEDDMADDMSNPVKNTDGRMVRSMTVPPAPDR
jgi:hypothetical protein